MNQSARFSDPHAEIEQLRAQVQELEDTLHAIRDGQVDAVVVNGQHGERVFTLQGADHAYRVMVEAMNEGAIIASDEGLIQYCNRSFAEMMELPMERLLGSSILSHVDTASRFAVESLIELADGRRQDVLLRSAHATPVQAYLSAKRLTMQDGSVALHIVAMDIRELRQTESALRNARLKYRSLFDNASEGIFQVTAQGLFIGANPAMARVHGQASPEQLLRALNGSPTAPYTDPDRRQQLFRALRQRGVVVGFESEIRRADGSLAWISENLHAVHDAGGELQFYEGNAVDITERRQYEQQLERHANYDPLTGLANRRRLQQRLSEAIAAADAGQHQLAVIYIDLDNFKTINDALGHTVGDRLLMVAGDRLRQCLRPEDLVARQGGDEFVMVLERSDAASLPLLVSRLLSSVAEPMLIDEHELHVTCSVGFSLYPADGRDADTLLKNADAAMYLAKDQGRNNVQAFTEDLSREIGRKLSLESALRRAFREDKLDLCYQPQLSMQDNRLVGAESLLRWAPGTPEERRPVDFVPIAEDTGLIVPIGEWVLRTACLQCRDWLAQAPDMRIAVNLSPRQFREKGLAKMVARILEETGLPARHLDLELTESLVMHNAEAAIATLSELCEMGLHISIDDFGVGYSNLSYLKRFPIHVLKIDRFFVRDVASATDNTAAITDTIINLGHSMGLRVVAEGVENREQLDYLRRHGCDEYQGFLVSPAVRGAEFAERFLSGAALR